MPLSCIVHYYASLVFWTDASREAHPFFLLLTPLARLGAFDNSPCLLEGLRRHWVKELVMCLAGARARCVVLGGVEHHQAISEVLWP